jgi:dihydrofolate reductase
LRSAFEEKLMRKLIVTEWMTLDGVVQAPGDPDEDKAAGFLHGGWHLPYFDDISREWVIQNLTEAGGFLLGRRTYESFAPHWPNAPADEQVIAEPLNSQPKYVASTTLSEPLEWQHSSLLRGDVAAAVAALKQQDGGDLLVIGSSGLVRTLIARDLVDEFRLMLTRCWPAAASASSATTASFGRCASSSCSRRRQAPCWRHMGLRRDDRLASQGTDLPGRRHARRLSRQAVYQRHHRR